MSVVIIKLEDIKENKNYYMEWSTISDGPRTYGMSLEAFKIYYLKRYGTDSTLDLEQRLRCVELKGTSSFIYDNIDSQIKNNRAGKNEKCLSKEEIIQEYCRLQE